MIPVGPGGQVAGRTIDTLRFGIVSIKGDRSQLILDLCDSWVTSATAGGGLRIVGGTERFRLRNNGLVAHEFSYAELRAACIGLTRVLLVPGMTTVIDWDHFSLWAWCAELLVGKHSRFFDADEREIKDLLGLACRASLAGAYPPGGIGWPPQHLRRDSMEPNARELVTNAQKVLPYLALPLLEAIVKKACSAYVNYSGDVVARFQLRNRRYEIGARISSLGDLLSLLYTQVAGPELAQALSEVRRHLAQFSSGDPFDMLYRWRNDSLHGAAMLPTIGGTVLTVALTIAIDQINNDYERLRNVVSQELASEARSASTQRNPWTFYPPWALQRPPP